MPFQGHLDFGIARINKLSSITALSAGTLIYLQATLSTVYRLIKIIEIARRSWSTAAMWSLWKLIGWNPIESIW